MFCTKYKKRIKELEDYAIVYEQRIKNQTEAIDDLYFSNQEFRTENQRMKHECRIISSLKAECLQKSEQISKLQELVNNRNEDRGVEDIDKLKQIIEKQAAQIARLEAFKKRIQKKKKKATKLSH